MGKNGDSDTSTNNLPELPLEVWMRIAFFLELPDIGRLARVCRGTNAFINTPAFWEQRERERYLTLQPYAFFCENYTTPHTTPRERIRVYAGITQETHKAENDRLRPLWVCGAACSLLCIAFFMGITFYALLPGQIEDDPSIGNIMQSVFFDLMLGMITGGLGCSLTLLGVMFMGCCMRLCVGPSNESRSEWKDVADRRGILPDLEMGLWQVTPPAHTERTHLLPAAPM